LSEKIFGGYLEGGLAGEVELDVEAGSVLLLGLGLGSVWGGRIKLLGV